MTTRSTILLILLTGLASMGEMCGIFGIANPAPGT